MPLSASPLHSVEEALHGVRVDDPYRWLEHRNLPQTQRWIDEQRRRCEAYFSACDVQTVLRNRVEALLNVAVVDQPARVGGLCFYRRREKGQEQACIYVREETLGSERLLIDPSGEGPFCWVGIHRISDDASLLAFEVKRGGGDTAEIRIVDVGNGRILPQVIENGYGRGFAFDLDRGGFYSCQEPSAGAGDHFIRFHSFLHPSRERTVFSRAGARGSRLTLIADTVHLGAIWIHGWGTEAVCDLLIASRVHDSNWQPIFVNKKLPCRPMLQIGRIFVLTYDGAINGRVVELTTAGYEVRTVVPPSELPIRQIGLARDRFFISCLDNGSTSIHRWTSDGRDAGKMTTPAGGTVTILPRLGPPADSLFYTHETFLEPPSIYEYEARTGGSSLFHQRAPSLDPSRYEVADLSIAAKDGTALPMTIVVSTEARSRRPLPLIMTSYGGFGVALTPRYSALVTAMMELGAAFALPHIRGGGEFGKPWHDAGRAQNRQTAIDDFIDAAEWLCAKGITNPQRLGLFGASNAGLLVAAAMTQRPHLFGAVLCIAALLDMVRYEHFDGAIKWQAEYGSAASEGDFRVLYAYSPYHHVEDGQVYPASMFVTGDKDDRCNPAHTRKMAARLEERSARTRPVIVDYSAERGHSPVLPLSVRIDALTRRLAFLSTELGIGIAPEVCRETAYR
jgi:prolyl oligopeptidase